MDNITAQQAELLNNSSPAMQLAKIGSRIQSLEENSGGGGGLIYANGAMVELYSDLGYDDFSIVGYSIGEKNDVLVKETGQPFDFTKAGLQIVGITMWDNLGPMGVTGINLFSGGGGTQIVDMSGTTYWDRNYNYWAVSQWKGHSMSSTPLVVYKNDLGLKFGSNTGSGMYAINIHIIARMIQAV